ncbi:MAG: amidohydrolase family protein [Oceanospirillaceae bacterium]|nr:amidohydrolase family protein [Oceanospirillaceae bacterium]
MKIIDPHLHLFDKTQGNYAWLAPDAPPFWEDKALINKNFSLDDIRTTAPIEHCGFVHIEAGFDNSSPWRELAWLESLAADQMKTVACVDLTQSTAQFNATLDRLCQYSSLCGVRHILDENAYKLLQNSQVQYNLSQIAERDLIFECQLNGADTQAIDALVLCLKREPTLKIVINHAAFPAPLSSEYVIWQNNMSRLSHWDNLFVKASGWEMLNRAYQRQHMQKIISWLLDRFTEDKIMLASNFPLCLFSCSYQSLWHCYSQLDFSASQLHALVYANAKRCYGF